MEVGGRRKCREMSPDRSKVRLMRPTFKRVQVVYYLSRNGLLEHPHFMEVTHLAHQPLRLKDVMDRLTVLRGKGMPSMYSWSCKRNYKSGYVWNDLGENDVIHSSEGAEFVLKGSELMEGCTEKLHHLQVSNVPILQFNPPKHKSLTSKARPEPEEMINNQFHNDNEDEEEEYEEKTSYTTSSTPLQSRRRSRGVSTDELVEDFKQSETPKNPPIEFNSSFSSPPSTTSSLSDKAINNETSKRFEDGDPVGTEPLLSRNSMLFSLIACGGSGSFRKAVVPPLSPPNVTGRKSESGSILRKGVVCKAAAKVAVEEDKEIIRYMSENPRFGNSQAEEKEYFSGSIAESMTSDERVRMMSEPKLKKSNSYNEERNIQLGGEEEEAVANNGDQEVKKVKAKCIPRIIF